MFILYNNEVTAFIPLENTKGMTCKQVHNIITDTCNDTERAKIGFFDVCKKSVKVQKTIKRNQISDDYFNYLKDSYNIT